MPAGAIEIYINAIYKFLLYKRFFLGKGMLTIPTNFLSSFEIVPP